MGDKIDRIGLVNKNNKDEEMIIITYNSSSDIFVQFLDEHKAIVHTTYSNFKKGEVLNPYRKSYYGRGYLGEGFKPSREDKSMKCWRNMLRRAYNENFLNLHPTYIGCEVCDDWLNFQNFHEWYNENYYSFQDQIMCLDKDIIVKGNKTYSPDTCVFVPQFINKLFTKRTFDRRECVIGVYRENKSYVASCSVFDLETRKSKIKTIGYFKTEMEAFLEYKQFKESYIRATAKKYKNELPIKLVNAMLQYEVHIND